MTRLDQALVERGFCDSREKAKRAIMAGTVKINGQLARKPSDSVKPNDELALTEPEKFVSRGGHKLEHALKFFHLNVSGLTAVDLGASTGGFTDCLLQHGAARVFAVDVGQGQLAWKLRQDPRVVVMEKTNARELRPGDLRGEPSSLRFDAPKGRGSGDGSSGETGNIEHRTEFPREPGKNIQHPTSNIEHPMRIAAEPGAVSSKAASAPHPHPGPLPSDGRGRTRHDAGKKSNLTIGHLAAAGAPPPAHSHAPIQERNVPPRPPTLDPLPDLITIDCSFISLRKILPPAVALLRPSGNIVALIKPQFEAGKAEADKGEGVITDPAVHERVLRGLEEFVARDNSLRWRGVTESPLLGPAGNKEFLVLIEKTG